MFLLRHLILVLCCFSLFACGPESTQEDQTAETNPTTPQEVTITTQHTIKFKPESELSWVDLADAVVSDQPNILELSEVSPLSKHNHCDVIQIKNLKYQIETANAQVCRYKYRVKAKAEQYQGHSEGISQVVVSDTTQDVTPLQPIGQTVYEDSTEQIDISENLPSNYHLDATSIELTGSTSTGNLGTAEELQQDVIQYTSPINTTGNVEIYYSAINELTDSVKTGVIYITLGDLQSGLIADAHRKLEEKVLADEPSHSFKIDVAEFVTAKENQSITLVEVYTNGQGTRVVTPNSTEFLYKPNYTGNHYINYVVQDETGSYAMGGLTFNVVSYRSIYDPAQKLTFSPTYTFNEIARMGGSYSRLNSESGVTGEPGYYPTFNGTLANAYCITEGKRLPTSDELSSMFNHMISPGSAYTSEYRWPVGSRYATDYNLDNKTIRCSLSSGKCYIGNDIPAYVTCVKELYSSSGYSFEQALQGADWEEKSTLLASASDESETYYHNLPKEEYQLSYKVVKTVPEELNDMVKVKIVDNAVTVSRTNDSLKQATLELQSPNVSGDIDKVTLLIGLSECPSNVTVNETQVLGCIPVIYEADGTAFTAALPDQLLSQLGFDLLNNTPNLLRNSNSTPNYSYFSPQTNISYHTDIAEFITPLCDKLNASMVAGRDNWTWAWDKSLHGSKSGSRYLQGNLASELTNWISTNTGLNVGMLGQGFFQITAHNANYITQSNQTNSSNRIYSQSFKQWQYITCVSKN
ncbi:hypothetical protein [Vibrio crassostreae]|uniref:Uncharacterized protein n=1 Tax=Vibrio crassostreae TaxID=246167 RepID=A0ABM9QTZ8_9VIBR|nr:hypothetical protein [Vibrio crassostreae]ROS63520.1 hypothetical protein EDB73_11085 [Vibrio crassostreae]RPF24046.1 hypothetical protein EDB12_0900 [Vibrio crassostreae]TCL29201.1 hypothetical protein EDB52_102489 [Vibrio crassostreae]TCT51969.1 hypothetical protein EDB39_102490 [Vibrio crassostreae]TCT60580.1 hypothetical protein EDB40_1037 [Vibrio crassostreae]